MDVKVTLKEDMAFVGTADSGHLVNLDASENSGGHNTGFRPTELVAIGTAGCSSMDVISILRKKKVNFSNFEVKVHVDSYQEGHPHVFTLMEFEYIITGKDIRYEDVERAVQLSEEKYCQCIAMMSKTAEIKHKITIIEE